jgi:hypothetical protein
MLKIGSIRWHGKCPRHPRFDPKIDGIGGIRGGCEKCALLAEIHAHHAGMLNLMRRFAPPQHSRKRAANPADLQANLFDET